MRTTDVAAIKERLGTMTSFEEAFAKIQEDENRKAERFAARQLRKFLAGALCCQCGEQLGEDEEIIQDDDECTIHKRCESP